MYFSLKSSSVEWRLLARGRCGVKKAVLMWVNHTREDPSPQRDGVKAPLLAAENPFPLPMKQESPLLRGGKPVPFTGMGGCQSESASAAHRFLSYRQSVRIAACHYVVVPHIQALPPAGLACIYTTMIFYWSAVLPVSW
jgi:hypothetical protein